MKNYKRISKAFCLSLAVASFMGVSSSKAGVVTIANNSQVAIKVNIVPGTEGLPYCWKCFSSKLQPHGKQIAEIIVPVDAFKGTEYFSVVDTEDGFLGNGGCYGLSILKNYEVLFSDTTLGTRCQSREI